MCFMNMRLVAPPSPPPLGPQPFLSSPVKGRVDPLFGSPEREAPPSPSPRASTPSSSTRHFAEQEKQRYKNQKMAIAQREAAAALRMKGQQDYSARRRADLIAETKTEMRDREAREALLKSAQAKRPLTAGMPRAKMGPKDATAVASPRDSDFMPVSVAITSARKNVQALVDESVRQFSEKSKELDEAAQKVSKALASQRAQLDQQASNLARRRETFYTQQRIAAQRADKLSTQQRFARDEAASKAESLRKRILAQREKAQKARADAWNVQAHWQPSVPPTYKSISSPRGWNEQLSSDSAHKRRAMQRTAFPLTVPSPRSSPPATPRRLALG